MVSFSSVLSLSTWRSQEKFYPTRNTRRVSPEEESSGYKRCWCLREGLFFCTRWKRVRQNKQSGGPCKKLHTQDAGEPLSACQNPASLCHCHKHGRMCQSSCLLLAELHKLSFPVWWNFEKDGKTMGPKGEQSLHIEISCLMQIQESSFWYNHFCFCKICLFEQG